MKTLARTHTDRRACRRAGRCQGVTRRDFTMVELLLVLVILATLAAVVVPKFTGRSKQAKITAAATEIASIEVALDAFEVDNGFYPEGNDGLVFLVERPSDAPDWRGPYLKKAVRTDPWGNPYLYEYPGKQNTEGYDLSSSGPDGRAGNDDDICNWDSE
ncbi:MAG: type II secretion system major pseudopilin GspG [Lentisphaeria bacterium]|nr:type II secretion system major pseudopilin GspG [Lentisphaeria bacterium]